MQPPPRHETARPSVQQPRCHVANLPTSHPTRINVHARAGVCLLRPCGSSGAHAHAGRQAHQVLQPAVLADDLEVLHLRVCGRTGADAKRWRRESPGWHQEGWRQVPYGELRRSAEGSLGHASAQLQMRTCRRPLGRTWSASAFCSGLAVWPCRVHTSRHLPTARGEAAGRATPPPEACR